MLVTSRLSELLRTLPAIGSFAAEMGFYFALSLVPFLGLTAAIAVAWLPPEVGRPLADSVVRNFAPEAGLDAAAISGWVGSVQGSGWLAAGVLLAVWSSFRFIAAGVKALARLGGGEPVDWRHKLRSFASAVFLLLVWMLALLLLSFVVLIATPLEETLDQIGWVARGTFSAAGLSRTMAALVLLIVIALTYRTIPGTQARGWRLWLVSGLATGGWIAAGRVVTGLLPSLLQGQTLYGALGSFVLFLLWSYVNAWVLLFCGQLSGVLLRPAGTRGEAG